MHILTILCGQDHNVFYETHEGTGGVFPNTPNTLMGHLGQMGLMGRTEDGFVVP